MSHQLDLLFISFILVASISTSSYAAQQDDLALTTPQSNSDSSAPKIDQHPNSIIVNVSDPVTLECRASGSPKPVITWLKDGQALDLPSQNSPSANRYTLIHDSNLFIYSASIGKSNSGNKSSSGDAGVYQCRAENVNGVVVSGNASLSITYLKEDFRETPKSRQVNAGTHVVMDCKAPRGLPEPKLSKLEFPFFVIDSGWCHIY